MTENSGLIKTSFAKLNKDWWDLNESRYPQATAVFFRWLEKYREDIGWNNLIGCQYYQLPRAMQLGIFMEFLEHEKELYPNSTDYFMRGKDFSVFINTAFFPIVVKDFFHYHSNPIK